MQLQTTHVPLNQYLRLERLEKVDSTRSPSLRHLRGNSNAFPPCLPKLGARTTSKQEDEATHGCACPLVLIPLFLASYLVHGADGTSIYLTCDIGGAIERYEQHKFDEMLCVISSQQDLHTAQFIKMLHLDGVSWGVEYRGIEHAKRTVVFLVQIIREAASVMHEQMKKDEEKYAAVEDPEQTSVEVGLTGIKIQDMAANRCAIFSLLRRSLTLTRIKDYDFNWAG
jgi:hypothetical protein